MPIPTSDSRCRRMEVIISSSATSTPGWAGICLPVAARAARPDFALRVVPSSINARAGATVPLTVYALRQDGFTNDIALALQDTSSGFKLSGARIPANQDKVRLTLTIPADTRQEAVSLNLEGRATVQGRQIVRPAVPADDMMQAFFYRHLVLAKELKVAVSRRWCSALPW